MTGGSGGSHTKAYDLKTREMLLMDVIVELSGPRHKVITS